MLSPSLVLAMLIVTLPACGDGDDRSALAGWKSAPPAGETLEVDCGGSRFDFEQLTGAPPTESLAEGPANAVDDAGAPAFDPAQDWRVVDRSDEHVDLVRELEQPIDNGRGDVRTHESRTLARIEGAPNIPDGTWLLVQAGPCTPRLLARSDFAPADLTLSSQPAADATSIDVVVHERACASGQSAEGRIEILELEESDDEVRLRIGVRPREGGQSCQGNPSTRFTIELSEPLGTREIVDASIVPPRPLQRE